MAIKDYLPWHLRIASKLVLARLPLRYSIWQKLGLFRHGSMDSANYAQNVFDLHVKTWGDAHQLKGKTILELGCGDSVNTALLACAHGARSILVDVGSFAIRDMAHYRGVMDQLHLAGLPLPESVRASHTFEEMLTYCGSRYLTDGIESLKSLDSRSADLIFSQAVLEHIRRHSFVDLAVQIHRLLKSEGVSSHCVDLRDHLGGQLNNLRFSEKLWESDFFTRSGFYTNRIQYHRMVEIMAKAGFSIEVRDLKHWATLPIQRKQLASPFNHLSDAQLNVQSFHMICKVKG